MNEKKVQLSRVGRREVDAVSSFQYSLSNNLTDLLREVAYKTFSINTWKEKVCTSQRREPTSRRKSKYILDTLLRWFHKVAI